MPVKQRPPNRARRASTATLIAPTGGLNQRDALSDMPLKYAYRLENWFPRSTSIDTRNGCEDYATGLPGAVESLEVYTGANGPKMLAFSSGSIYDVSLGGAVGASLATGKVSNKVTSCMFSNAGAQLLLVYSGADQPLSYNGVSLTGLTITGLTGSQNTLHSPHPFKGRVFLCQEGLLGFYYLAVGAIQGAASFFDLSQQTFKGGTLATIASFSQESSGTGPNDYAVFVTTEGEYVMYAGTDPSSASAWTLVGRFYGPKVIGRKSWFRFRSDLYFLTEEGVLSFTQIRQMGESADDVEALTDVLGNLFLDTLRYENVHGWCGLIYPRGDALYINVPQTASESGRYTQFVMNTKGDQWTQYLGWNALCWALFDRRAYYGTYDGRVVLADEGTTDNGTEIRGTACQAWYTYENGKGMGQADKQFHIATFSILSDGVPALSARLNVNYETTEPTTVTSIAPPEGAEWDVAEWDVAEWAGDATIQNVSVNVSSIGHTASIFMRAASTAGPVKWLGTRVIFEQTQGVLLQ